MSNQLQMEMVRERQLQLLEEVRHRQLVRAVRQAQPVQPHTISRVLRTVEVAFNGLLRPARTVEEIEPCCPQPA